jgi:hypothetical protein
MLAELFFVTAQACQNGQCPTVKESLTVATTVTVINGPPAWLAYYDTKWTYGWIAPRPSYSSAFHQMLRGNPNDISPIG